MATDPTISLDAQTPQIDFGAIYSEAMQLRQMRDAMQFDNSLKTILSSTPVIKPDGTTDPTVMAKIARLGPKGLEFASKIADQQSQVQERQAQTKKATAEASIDEMKGAHESVQSGLDIYDSELAGGTDPNIAERDLKSSLHDYVYKQPWGKERQDNNWQALSSMNPQQLRAAASKLAMTVEQRLAAGRLDVSEGNLAEKEQHDKVTERQGGERIKIAKDAAAGAQDATLDQAGIDYAAQRYRDTGTLPPLGMGKAAAKMRQQIIERAAQLSGGGAQGADADVARAADTKAVTAGLANLGKMRASVEQAEGNASKEAGLVESLLDKGGLPGGPSAFGKWVQDARTGVFNDPDASAFQTATESLKNEYVKVLSTTGGMAGGQSSDAARREADQYINPRLSKEQIRSNIAVMRKSMANRTSAINDAYAKERGRLSDRGEVAGPELAHPRSKAEFDALPKGAHYSKPGDPPGSYRVKG